MKMSGWTYILIGGILSLVGTILLTHGWNQLKKREEAFSLSIPPSLEMMVTPNEQDGKQNIIIQNTGQHELIKIETTPVFYKIQKEPLKILSRDLPSGGIAISNRLNPKEEISLLADKLTYIVPDEEHKGDGPLNALVLVTTFRREADNKRFVIIEPFTVAKIENRKVLFALYSGKNTAVTGPPMTNIIKEIIETEKLYFRAE